MRPPLLPRSPLRPRSFRRHRSRRRTQPVRRPPARPAARRPCASIAIALQWRPPPARWLVRRRVLPALPTKPLPQPRRPPGPEHPRRASCRRVRWLCRVSWACRAVERRYGRRGRRGRCRTRASNRIGGCLVLRDRGIRGQPGADRDGADTGLCGHDRDLTRQLLRLTGQQPEVDARRAQSRAGRQDEHDLDVLARSQTGDGRGDLVVRVEEDDAHDQTFMARRTRRRAVSRGDSVEAISMAWYASPIGVTSC